MSLQYALPESVGKTPMQRMRLVDMRRVAAAFNIPIDHSAVADKIRHTLIDQEAMGTFMKPCPHPERLTPQGYFQWMQSDMKTEEGPTKAELAAELADLKAKMNNVPSTTEPTSEVKFRGPKHRWCRMVDGEWVTGFQTREAAEA